MKFMTGYVWPEQREAGERVSLLLQQVQFGRRSIVLAAIGGDGEREAVCQLKNWFQCGGVVKCAKAEPDRVGRILGRLLESCQEEGQFIGILIVEESFWLMARDEGCAYLLNRRFQRTHIKMLSVRNEAQNIGHPQKDGMRLVGGTLEKGLGILLGSPGFYQGVTREGMKQCLASQEIHRERQIGSRLQELAEEGARQSATKGCAIYIRTI